MLSEQAEEYLEAIYTLTEGEQAAKTTELAKHLHIAPPSVTEMLQKLASEGYVTYSAYKGVTLTLKGLKRARKMTRKHRLLEQFLHRILRLDKKKIHDEACKMEHSLSDEAEDSLCRFLGHPDKCPDDEKPIPPCEEPFNTCEECLEADGKPSRKIAARQINLLPLMRLREHELGRIAFIRGDRKAIQRLFDLGLTPGTPISIVRTAPLHGPIEVSVRGSRVALGFDIASKVFVEPMTPQGKR